MIQIICDDNHYSRDSKAFLMGSDVVIAICITSLLVVNMTGVLLAEHNLRGNRENNIVMCDESVYIYSVWPTFGRDSQNTRRSPYNTDHVDGTIIWTYKPEKQITPFNIISDDSGNLYFGAEDNKLYCLSSNGSLEWTYEFDFIPYYLGINDERTIYLTSNSGGDRLYAVDSNGSFKWKSDAIYRMSSSPAIGKEGTIFFGSIENRVIALFPNGNEKWNKKINGSVATTPAIDKEGNLYVVSNDDTYGYITALTPEGKTLWSKIISDWIYSVPSIGGNGTIYFGTEKLHAFSINGTEKWVYDLDTKISTSFAISEKGTVFLVAEMINLMR